MLIGKKNVLNQQISNGIALKSVVSFIFRVTSFHIDSAPQNPLPQESLGVLIPLMHSTPFLRILCLVLILSLVLERCSVPQSPIKVYCQVLMKMELLYQEERETHSLRNPVQCLNVKCAILLSLGLLPLNETALAPSRLASLH